MENGGNSAREIIAVMLSQHSSPDTRKNPCPKTAEEHAASEHTGCWLSKRARFLRTIFKLFMPESIHGDNMLSPPMHRRGVG